MNKTLPNTMLDKNPVLQFLVSTKYRILRHALMIAFIGIAIHNSPADYTEPTETVSQIIVTILLVIMAYINMYYFVPKFLFKNQYIKYLYSIIGILLVSYLINQLGKFVYSADVTKDKDDLSFFSFSFVIIVLISASAAIKLFQRWMIDTQLISELVKANANAELEQLKNQINPHFLFNMLNNVNVLTKKDPEKASQVLMKLSDLLRYQLYDSAREKVFLTSDIRFLEDFLNLEKVRRDNFDYLISKEGDINGVQIPPLLFISFVENAVKHNNDSSKDSYINLYFEVKNKQLFFKCINSKPLMKAVNTTSGGLGLVNVKRRLSLLFPTSHELTIIENQETYSVLLNINL